MSGEAFLNNLSANPKDDKNKNYADYKTAGITINFMKSHITFNLTEKDMFRKKIKEGFWMKFCNLIVFPNDREGHLMQEFCDLPNNTKYKAFFEWR